MGRSSRAALSGSRRASAKRAVGAKAGLADALFGRARQRVLGLLYGQPERSFFATELIALARSGSGAVQRELSRLSESGLVTVVPVGRQRRYRANVDAPIFEELRGIVVKTVGLDGPLRAALEAFGSRLRLALVFGSVAKERDRASSDIDLLVVSDDLTLEKLYRALVPVEAQLGRSVQPTLYTSAEFRQRRSNASSFVHRVLDGPHRVLIGSVDGIT